MNTPLLPAGMDLSHISTIHLTTISSSMHVSGMMLPRLLHPPREGMPMQLLVLKTSTHLETTTKHTSVRILTPQQMIFYQIHQTKQSRKPPTPLSGFQKDHSRKPTSTVTKKSSDRKKYDGPVYVPAEVYKLLSPEAVIALKKYNSEALNKMAKKRGIHVTDITDQVLSIAETNISEEQVGANQDEDEPEGEADPILDYINSQHHQEDDMNHALQSYNIMTSPFADTTPQRSINSVHTHLFYHVAQAKQAQHGSHVDRRANGGLAGFDVRVLSKSSRKCTVISRHTYCLYQIKA